MPRAEYTPFVLERLFRALRDDPDLRDSVAQVKVKDDPREGTGEVMPTVVIYTQLGKENAQSALDRLYNHLGDYAEIGLDRTPRYNRKVNELIYYAQSGGDLKNDYLKAARSVGRDIEKDGIFEPDLVHFRGDYRLEIPEGGGERVSPDGAGGVAPKGDRRGARAEATEPTPEVPAVKEVPYSALNPGDRIEVDTQNSHYEFEVTVDPSTGRRGLKAIGETGTLSGTEGWVNTNVLRVGGRLWYGKSQSSTILDFTVRRSLKHGVREWSTEDKEALENLRIRLREIDA